MNKSYPLIIMSIILISLSSANCSKNESVKETNFRHIPLETKPSSHERIEPINSAAKIIPKEPIDFDGIENIYSAPFVPEGVLEITVDGTLNRPNLTQKIINNQIAITTNPGVRRDEVDVIAASVGGIVVGQIPRRNRFQIQVLAKTKEKLDEKISQLKADEKVQRAGYNYLIEYSSCWPESDNDSLNGNHRCSLDSINYYQALTLFEAAKPYLSIYPVNVAVIDTGLISTNGEFDDVNIVNLNHPRRPELDRIGRGRFYGHGTKICGIIAADNDGKGVNGIASRFLERQLTLMVGAVTTIFETEVMIDRAINCGVDVISLSIYNYEDQMIDVWSEVISNNSDVFFVVIAKDYNVSSDIDVEEAFPPAGLALDNVITVGGLEPCDLRVFKGTNLLDPDATNEAVEIRAPAKTVPVVDLNDGHRVRFESGNSYAAPQVASLAAILRAIDPNLSGAQIKGYLRQYPLLTPGPYINYRLKMDYSIAKLLLDIGVEPSIFEWITHPVTLEGPLPSAVMMSNICGEMVFYIAGIENFHIKSMINAHGKISGESSAIYINFRIGDDNYRGEFHSDFPFQLDTYDITEERVATTIGFNSRFGRAIDGEISFESSRITERHPESNEPIGIAMSGTFNGVLRDDDVTREFEGFFNNIYFNFHPPIEDDSLIQYFEQNSAGGIVR